MSGHTTLQAEMREFARKWEQITEIPDPPRTVMNVIEYSLTDQQKAEVYTTRLLRYFLDPTEPHGLETELLDMFLETLPAECNFQEDTYDLSDVKVEDEVKISNSHGSTETESTDRTGFADLVLQVPGEWFLLIELKFSAGENNVRGEGQSQTEFYYHATQVDDRPKSEYESGKYYLYIHQDNKAQARESHFANLTWSSVTTDCIGEFVRTHSPRLPQRTVRQLRELIDDIQTISDMSEQGENTKEKIAQYVEHYDAITEVTNTFDTRWDEFTEEWWTDVSQRIGDDERIDNWYGIEGVDDWAYIFKHGWWRRQETLEPIDGQIEGDTVRLGFLHRLDHHRELAVGDRTLKFQFRNCPPNRYLENQETNYRDEFYENFEARRDEIKEALPDAASLTGNMHNQIEATYDIPVDTHDGFFEAYVAALEQALTDHALENDQLVTLIDSIQAETLQSYK